MRKVFPDPDAPAAADGSGGHRENGSLPRWIGGAVGGRRARGAGGMRIALRQLEDSPLRSGFTLPELAMAIAIISVLVSIGWYTAQDSIARNRMIRVARMLQSDIQMLRTIAITTNRQTRMKLVHADAALSPAEAQQGEWLLQVGNRSDRSNEWDTLPINEADWSGAVAVVDDEGERSLAAGGRQETPWISLAPWSALSGPGLDNADCVVFSPRGWIENPPEDFRTGYISMRVVNKRAMLDESSEGEWVDLKLARGGLARMEFWNAAGALPANAVGTAEATGVTP